MTLWRSSILIILIAVSQITTTSTDGTTSPTVSNIDSPSTTYSNIPSLPDTSVSSTTNTLTATLDTNASTSLSPTSASDVPTSISTTLVSSSTSSLLATSDSNASTSLSVTSASYVPTSISTTLVSSAPSSIPATLDSNASTTLSVTSAVNVPTSVSTKLVFSASVTSVSNASTSLSATSASNLPTSVSTTLVSSDTSSLQATSVSNAPTSVSTTLVSSDRSSLQATSASNASTPLSVTSASNSPTSVSTTLVSSDRSSLQATSASNASTPLSVTSASNAPPSVSTTLVSSDRSSLQATSASNASTPLSVTSASNAPPSVSTTLVSSDRSSLQATSASNASTPLSVTSASNAPPSVSTTLVSSDRSSLQATSASNASTPLSVTSASNAPPSVSTTLVSSDRSSLQATSASNASTPLSVTSASNAPPSVSTTLVSSDRSSLQATSASNASTPLSVTSASNAPPSVSTTLVSSDTSSLQATSASNASTSLSVTSVSNDRSLITGTTVLNSTLLPVTSNTLSSNITTSSSVTDVSTTKVSPFSTTTMQVTTMIATVLVPLEFKIINQNFTEELKNTTSPEFINLKFNVEDQLTNVYKNTFRNFKKVNVTGFRKGSVITSSTLEFENTETPAPSSDNAVRALVISLQSNSSVGNLQLMKESISSNNISLLNLPPLNISVNFLIKTPYNESVKEILKTQTVYWVQNTLLMLPNSTVAADPSITFTNSSGWTYTSAYFAINTPYLFDETTALNNLMSTRNVNFSIVPSTLVVQGKTLTFNMISLPLRILNIPESPDLSLKSSNIFQVYSKAIEDSFKDVFSQNLVEPVVNNFTNDPLPVIALVDLYFQNDTINKTKAIQDIITNEAKFRSRNINVDLFFLDPKAGVLVAFTLIQDYTSSLANSSSSDATALQNTFLGLLTPELKQFYSNSLQDAPAVSFKDVGGSAAMMIGYKLKYTINVDSANVLASLQKNSNFISIIRRASLYVNNMKTDFDVFTFYPRFLNHNYSTELKDRNNQVFKNLEHAVISGFSDMLTTFNLQQLVVISFKPGSVISEIEMTLPPGTTSSSQLAQVMAKNKNVLQNYGLILDPESVYTSLPTFPPPGTYFPGYAVAIIVMCILVILAIPLFILLALKTDLCRKLSNACSLKPPYERYHGVDILPNMSNYKTHSYELPH